MAPKLKPDPIGAAEMKRYLETESDFDFELKVLRALTQMGMRCEHGGHYEDPVTKKIREFDIRLRRDEAGNCLFAAIECKNLRTNFPLLVSCVPRTESEAWHEIVHLEDNPRRDGGGFPMPAGLEPRSTLHRISGEHTRYGAGEWVGKNTAQVGLTPSGEIYAQDSEIHEKWGQCLASPHDLGPEIESLPHDTFAMALPIIVVPNDRLWWVLYNADGSRAREPEPVDRCAVYCGGSEIKLSPFDTHSITHVEMMTYHGLLAFVHQDLRDADGLRRLLMGRLHL